jgi:transposase
LPAHLPRIEVVIDVDDKACPCCGGSLHVIGEDPGEEAVQYPNFPLTSKVRGPCVT